MVNILPFGREKEPSHSTNEKGDKQVSFSETGEPRDDSDIPKRRNSFLCFKDKPKPNIKNQRSAKPPRHKASLISMQAKPAHPSRFKITTEILAQDTFTPESENHFWREQMEEARQRYYGVTGGRPRYGWESPNKSKPTDLLYKTTSTNNSHSKNNSSRSKSPSKLRNLKGLGRSQSLGVNPSRAVENSPTPSTREVWNTLYSKNQEIHSLRLSHQEILEELHAHQIGLRSHKHALDEARWESEECYQTLSLLNQLAGEGKHFDEKVWVERIQLRNRIRQLEKETEELRVKEEQCRQMLDSVDAIWFKEWKEKEALTQELKGARAENKRLNVQLEDVCKKGGRSGSGSQLERRDSSMDGDFYDAQERAGQPRSANGSRKSSPGSGEAEGPRIPPRVSSLHWKNLARSASARREQFEREERSKSMDSMPLPKPSTPLEAPQAQSEEERLSPQPGQVWWTQLYGWPTTSEC
ncbi:hypothetical protein Vi05172_g11410 [Venturia inaequalis]|nr:hypothetical protein Vi05172_g11410 [Venturia inaequalis]